MSIRQFSPMTVFVVTAIAFSSASGQQPDAVETLEGVPVPRRCGTRRTHSRGRRTRLQRNSGSPVQANKLTAAEIRQARALYRSRQRVARLEHNLWMGYEPLRPNWNAMPMMSSRYNSRRVYVPYFFPHALIAFGPAPNSSGATRVQFSRSGESERIRLKNSLQQSESQRRGWGRRGAELCVAMAVKLPLSFFIPLALLLFATGCVYFPESRERDVIHNPFPQLKRVAVLPFYNQSNEPTVNGEQVAEAYYAALQAVPGFEVLPVGVAKLQWMQFAAQHGEPRSGEAFQRLAEQMGVEALVVGAVTDFEPYYPPRMAMTVHWYAANQGFHPIPVGYGMPWGTDAEKQIPRRIVRDAEFELARSQLATQTPIASAGPNTEGNPLRQVANHAQLEPPLPEELPPNRPAMNDVADDRAAATWVGDTYVGDEMSAPLPPSWPEVTDLIPDPPSPERPIAVTNRDPVLVHTKLYRGDDAYFTNRLADYVETGDDARPGGWQDYLKRSDDFVRFCCHLHIVEMLESRGGRDQSDLILRWPLSRY